MLAFLKIFAFIYLAVGVYFMIHPAGMKTYIAYWKKPNRLYIGGILAFCFSVIFLATASKCTIPFVPYALGVLALIKSFLIFVLKPKGFEPLLAWYETRSLNFIRYGSVLPILIGVILYYSV